MNFKIFSELCQKINENISEYIPLLYKVQSYDDNEISFTLEKTYSRA